MRLLPIIVFGLLLVFIRQAKASELLFNDQFNGELDWYVVRNASHHDFLQSCLTVTGIPRWDLIDQAVQININGSLPCSTELLPLHPAGRDLRAYAVELRLFISEPKMDRNLLLRWRDSRNHLGFHLFGEGINVIKVVSGITYPLTNGSRGYNFASNRWYNIRMEQDLSARSIKLYIDNQLIIDATEPADDPQLEWGKPGLAASVGAVSHSFARFDDFQVSSLGHQFDLAVENVKQTDTRWSNDIYDHANSWSSNPTIARWGCALSTAVAVLRFHGIDKLPSGEWLEPGTLNHWLQNESDGYMPGGNLNWRALTRLSLWHAQQFDTPTLEMTYESPTNQLEWLRQQIDARLPVILAQPGHFITAYGYGPGSADINIADPFYNRLRLSEYGQKFLSARLFTPSNTDLSAISITVPIDASVSFTNANNQPIAATQIIEYPLDGSSPYRLFDLPKPNGPVTIKIHSWQTLVPVWVATYNIAGDAQLQQNTVVTSDGESEWPANNAATELNLSQLSALYNSHHLKHPTLITLVLEYQQALAETTNLNQAQSLQRRYKLILTQARKHDWLDDLYLAGLISHSNALLLAKYP